MKTTTEYLISLIGPLLTGIGLLLALRQLRANHDWNRRNYAANLVSDWNDKTSSHRKIVEFLRPGLIDLDKQGDVVELTKKDAVLIYTSKPGENGECVEWQLRFHFIEMLNYFESIAVAYDNCVGDQRIIEDSVRNPLIRWCKILHNFIETVEEHRGYKPWKPYTSLVKRWEQDEILRRKNTA